MGLKNVWNKFLDLLFPEYRCVICGREVFDTESRLCENCKKSFPKIVGKVCAKCGAPIEDSDYVCELCKNFKYEFDEARASFIYSKDTSRVFFGIKYGGKKYLAKFLAREMFETLKNWGVVCDIIVPVPLSEERKKQRGYNQSMLIAEELSALTGKEVDESIVSRIKDVPTQTKLSQKERMENLQGVFKLNRERSIAGKNILIVDDVFTTGATASSLAKELRKAKPNKIYVLTAGKTIFYNLNA